MFDAPLFFKEDFHPALWGGERWLVSAHPAAPSVVREGPFAGQTLDRLVRTYGASLTGRCLGNAFPLLLKEIRTRDRLSVQVHPNARTAPLTGGEPKTEMWHVLSAGPKGAVFAGCRPGVTTEALAEAAKAGTLEDLLLRHPVTAGESVFIPGGLVHAIGEGVEVFEVQQSSTTTYRLYDWGRVDAGGKPRALHLTQALAACDPGSVPVKAVGSVSCPFFTCTPAHLTAPTGFAADGETCRVIFVTAGALALKVGSKDHALSARETAFVPAHLPFTLAPAAPSADVLVISA